MTSYCEQYWTIDPLLCIVCVLWADPVGRAVVMTVTDIIDMKNCDYCESDNAVLTYIYI